VCCICVLHGFIELCMICFFSVFRLLTETFLFSGLIVHFRLPLGLDASAKWFLDFRCIFPCSALSVSPQPQKVDLNPFTSGIGPHRSFKHGIKAYGGVQDTAVWEVFGRRCPKLLLFLANPPVADTSAFFT